MSDPSSQPTQPLTDEELAAIRALWADILASNTEETSFGASMVSADVHLFDLKFAKVLGEVSRLRAENTALAAKVGEFLDDERRIARCIDETSDQSERMRLLGLAEARKTLRTYLGDDWPTGMNCSARSQFFADDLLYTIGCGRAHGHDGRHYSFTAELAWVDGSDPSRAEAPALGLDQDGRGQ